MSSLLRIAFRNVLRNRRRSLITFSAVFVALGVVTSIRGFLGGLQASLRESVVLGQTGAVQVHAKGFRQALEGGSLTLTVPADTTFLAKVAAVPGVTAIAPRIAFGAMVNVGDTTTPALFTAVDRAAELRVCPRRAEMIHGPGPNSGWPAGAGVLTPELTTSLGAALGSSVTVLASDETGALNGQDLTVWAHYGQAGLPVPEKKIGFVPLDFAQDLLRLDRRATELAIAVDDPRRADEVARGIATAVGAGYEVSTWREVMPWVDEAIRAQDFMVGLLTATFLFVALLGIVNTMLMSVYERTREVGTMISVGVRRRQILGLFLVEAGLLGLAGGALGASVGGGLVTSLGKRGIAVKLGGMATAMHIHPTVDANYVAMVLALGTIGATVAALWPALRASRLRPVEALGAV